MNIAIPTGEASNGQILVSNGLFFVPQTAIGVTARAPADFATGSTSLTSVTGLSLPVDPLSWYDVDSFILVQSSDSSGLIVGVTSTDASASHNGIMWGTTNTATSASVASFIAPATSPITFVAMAAVGQIYIKGTLFSITGGTYSVMIGKVSSGTATVFGGASRLTMIKIQG